MLKALSLAAAAHLACALTDDLKHQHKLELSFGIMHVDASLKELERELLARSSPSSPLHGKWLSSDQVQAITTPLADDVATVEDYLRSHGVSDLSYSLNKDWIMATVTVAAAEKILGARYAMWSHPQRDTVIRFHPDHSLQLPARVRQAVALVEPTKRMPPVAKWLTEPMAPRGVDNTPSTLRALCNA